MVVIIVFAFTFALCLRFSKLINLCCVMYFMFQTHPITDIYFELLDHDIEIYSAKIKIIADLGGLRYLMFHWPILSSTLGIGSNLLFVFFVFFMSWRHIYGSEIFENEPNGNKIKINKYNQLICVVLLLFKICICS